MCARRDVPHGRLERDVVPAHRRIALERDDAVVELIARRLHDADRRQGAGVGDVDRAVGRQVRQRVGVADVALEDHVAVEREIEMAVYRAAEI